MVGTAISGIGMVTAPAGGAGDWHAFSGEKGTVVLSELPVERALRHAEPESALLVLAAQLAMGNERSHLAGDRLGIAVATRSAGEGAYHRMYWAGRDSSGRVAPVRGPHVGPNAPAAQLAIAMGARGPNITVSARATSFFAALDLAVAAIEDGSADSMLVCSVEVGGVDEKASPPADGAVALLVESIDCATDGVGGDRLVGVDSPRLRSFDPDCASGAVHACREAVEMTVTSSGSEPDVLLVGCSDSDLGARVMSSCASFAKATTCVPDAGELTPACFAARVAELREGRPTAQELGVLVDAGGSLSVVRLYRLGGAGYDEW